MRNEENSIRLKNQEELRATSMPTSRKQDEIGPGVTILMILLIVFGLAMIAGALFFRIKSRKMSADQNRREKEIAEVIDRSNRELAMMSIENIKTHEGINVVCDDLRKVLVEMNPRDAAKRDRLRQLLGNLESARNRLRKKLNIDLKEDLTTYLRSLRSEH